jgi:hypothetical protein
MVKRVLIYGEPKLGVYMRMTEGRRISATDGCIKTINKDL